MTPPRTSLAARRAAALAAVAWVGCRDASAPVAAGPATTITVVSGATFGGTVTEAVATSLALRVTDDRGRPVPGVPVDFSVTRGEGVTLDAATRTTDDAGRAAVQARLGTLAGGIEVQASVQGIRSPVHFSGIARPGPVARVAIAPRILRLRAVGDSALLRVDLQDAHGNVAPGGQVAFQSGDESLFTVSPTGIARALRSGATARVIATAGGRADTALVSVADPSLRPCAATSTLLAPAVGEVVSVSGATGLCVRADAAGGEYALVPFSASVASSGLTLLEVLPFGIVPPEATEAPTARVAPVEALVPDAAFERRIRSEDGATIARLARAPAPLAARGIPASVAVGQLLQLNTNPFSECGNPQLRTARVAAVSSRAIVVADTANPSDGYTDAEYAAFATTFDTLVHEVTTTAFGEPRDLDGNGRIVIFFTRAVNELSSANGSTYVGGYFWSRDFRERATCAGSNEGELFYMLVPDPQGVVTNSSGQPSRAFRKSFVDSITVGTIAHEYQHLINASRRAFVTRTVVAEEGWLNEALSHVAEELVFYRQSGAAPRRNLGGSSFGPAAYDAAFVQYANANFGRLRTYLQQPELFSPYADEQGTGTGIQARGASWAFLRYLVDQAVGAGAAGETDLWRRLVSSSTSGFGNLRQVLGIEPLDALRDWTLSVYLDDLLPVSPRYTQPSWDFRSAYPLLPGGARPFPLATRTLRAEITTSLVLRAGAATHLRFALPPGGEGFIQVTSSGIAPPATLRFTVVRTK